MGSPSYNPTDLLQGGLNRYLEINHALRARAAQYAALTDADTVVARDLVHLLTDLTAARALLVRVRDMPGIGVYAAEQLQQPTTDLAAVTNATITALDNVRTHLRTALPKDANGFLLIDTLDAADRPVSRTFSAGIAAMVTLRSLMTTLRDSVDPRPA